MSSHGFLLCGIGGRVFGGVSSWGLYPPLMLVLMRVVKAGEKGNSLLAARFQFRGGGLSVSSTRLRMGSRDWRLARGRCGWLRCDGRVSIR